MHKIIIGDNQAIYRAGIAKLLSTEDGNHIVAQCPDCPRLFHAIETFRGAIVIVASALKADFSQLMNLASEARSRVVVVAENVESFLPYTAQGASGVIFRGSPSAVLIDCVRRVAEGDTAVPPVGAAMPPEEDDLVGTNVHARLTGKELKIVSLIVQGMKNKEIATRLRTTEQVVKNYLRSIFDKTGVSDRLELALFTIHHRVLAAAAAEAAAEMELETRKS
jgi:DNA-binding NarL/FixJ family response regulator